jgi:hypothetical protein
MRLFMSSLFHSVAFETNRNDYNSMFKVWKSIIAEYLFDEKWHCEAG